MRGISSVGSKPVTIDDGWQASGNLQFVTTSDNRIFECIQGLPKSALSGCFFLKVSVSTYISGEKS